MDDLKMIMFLIILLIDVVACSKNVEQSTVPNDCKTYPSAYEIQFPDHTVQKSTVELCGSSYIATSESESFSSPELIVVLTVDGRQEYLFFDGQ